MWKVMLLLLGVSGVLEGLIVGKMLMPSGWAGKSLRFDVAAEVFNGVGWIDGSERRTLWR